MQSQQQALAQVWAHEKERLQAAKFIKNEIETMKQELDRAERKGDLARASELRFGILPSLQKQYVSDQQKTSQDAEEEQGTLLHDKVNAADIAAVVAKWAGIPVGQLLKSERQRLLHLEHTLSQSVVGQPEAVEAVAEAVRIARANVGQGRGVICGALFLGPTGTGKTELCRQASLLFFPYSAISCLLTRLCPLILSMRPLFSLLQCCSILQRRLFGST